MQLGMDVLDAARNVARDYPGGARLLGQRLGKSNLSDELNPHLTRAKLGLADAVEMELLAGDFRILHAHCAMTGHYPPLPMPIEDVEQVPGPCLRTLAELSAAYASLMLEVSHDLADDRITDNELAAAQRQWGQLVAKGQLLMQQLAGMNAALQRVQA